MSRGGDEYVAHNYIQSAKVKIPNDPSLTMIDPTNAQMNAMAYAIMPFAWISIFASSYIIYYLLLSSNRTKLKRMYHRLILSMNIALLILSFADAAGGLPIPRGTPGYVGNIGTQNTCTAQGFLIVVSALAVMYYNASLVLQAYLGIKNNFNEEKYTWIEKWVHFVAWCVPLGWAITFAVKENLNPVNIGCLIAKAPLGCDLNGSDVSCERGTLSDLPEIVFAVSHFLIFLLFPPVVILLMYLWIKKIERKRKNGYCRGMALIRESARKKLMKSCFCQLSLYLFTMWITWLPYLASVLIFYIHRDQGLLYNLNLAIFARCTRASTGFIFVITYFILQRMGRKLFEEPLTPKSSQVLTVSKIRANVNKGDPHRTTEESAAETSSNTVQIQFSVFDGVPDKASPWAKFIDPDEYDDEDEEDM